MKQNIINSFLVKIRSSLFLLVLSIFSHKAAGTQTVMAYQNIVSFFVDDIDGPIQGDIMNIIQETKAKVPTPNLDKLCDEGMHVS